MALITFKVFGTPPEEIIKELKIQFINVQDSMEKMCYDAKGKIDLTIRQSKKRAGSTNRLENSIQVEKTTAGWGLGNLNHMDSAAPHWYLINYGGMVSPRAQNVPGFFSDNMPPNPAMAGTGVGKDSFTNAKGYFMMHVNNPISPVNYIEKVLMWAKTVERVHLSGWRKKKTTFSKVI